MGRALGLLIAVISSCGTQAAPPSPPQPSVGHAAAPAAENARPSGPALDDGSQPTVVSVSEEDASERGAAKTEEEPTPASFGQPLEPGLYVFPDGLRLRVDQTAGCDFDTSVPCFGGTYRAHATLGKEEATVEWSTRSALVLRHRIEIVKIRVFVVRK